MQNDFVPSIPDLAPQSPPNFRKLLEPHGFNSPGWSSNRRLNDERTIYFIQSGDLVKVGITDDVQRRMQAFRAGAPKGLALRGRRTVPALFGRQIEKQIHIALDAHAVGREWFRLQAKEARAAADPIIARGWSAFRVYAEAIMAHEACLPPPPPPSGKQWTEADVHRLNGFIDAMSTVTVSLRNSRIDTRANDGCLLLTAWTAHLEQAIRDRDEAEDALSA